MHCPFCQHPDTRVIDSRLSDASNQIRRRRECPQCLERFNTLETAELNLPFIIKRNGGREYFDEKKLRAGLEKALQKRPVSLEVRDCLVQQIIHQLRNTGEDEVSSHQIGAWVMEALRQLDPVAYVRFASVYRSFEDIEAFREEIQSLKKTALMQDMPEGSKK